MPASDEHSQRQLSLFDPPPAAEGRPVPAAEGGAALFAGIDLEELRRIAAACTRCQLRAGCRQVVFGEGSPTADLMFVGEGPGEQEDRLGRPFVGAAGQLLDKILAAIGVARSEVYIANVVKCRPPQNRVPTAEEAEACWPYLERQIALIDPRIIVCLGATAAKRLIDPKISIMRSRGQWFSKGDRQYTVTFHPAALLRNPHWKPLAWEDFKEIRRRYRGGGLAGDGEGDPPTA
ncbi:MAG TPA: uracil-DNA glycosylase [Limnochordia bacterium]